MLHVEVLDPHPSETAPNAVVVDRIYDEHGVDALLREYAQHEIYEFEVEPAIMAFADDVSELAFTDANTIDIDLMREALERLHDGYDKAANMAKRKEGFMDRVLEHVGHVPQLAGSARRLDDRYWKKQFPDQFQEGIQRNTLPGYEPTLEDFQCYVRQAVHGLSWAYYTHAV